MRHPAFRLCLTFAFLISAAPTAAQSGAAAEESQRYTDCLEHVGRDPDSAFEDALSWRMQGGGWPARHCEARALIALGDVSGGAHMLETLARAHPVQGDPALQALLLEESGRAWLSIASLDNARRAYSEGLEIAPEFTALLEGHGRTQLERGEWHSVRRDANALLVQDGDSVEGLKLRIEAALALDELDDAQNDLDRALILAPDDIAVLVLRGRLIEARRIAGTGD